MIATTALRDVLLRPRARKGQRDGVTPLQREIRALEAIWGHAMVDAMLRVAQARAIGEHAVANSRIIEMAGNPKGARKRTEAVRKGSERLLKCARDIARSEPQKADAQ